LRESVKISEENQKSLTSKFEGGILGKKGEQMHIMNEDGQIPRLDQKRHRQIRAQVVNSYQKGKLEIS